MSNHMFVVPVTNHPQVQPSGAGDSPQNSVQIDIWDSENATENDETEQNSTEPSRTDPGADSLTQSASDHASPASGNATQQQRMASQSEPAPSSSRETSTTSSVASALSPMRGHLSEDASPTASTGPASPTASPRSSVPVSSPSSSTGSSAPMDSSVADTAAGSSAVSAPMPPPMPEPRTRLQKDIRQPKIFKDGMVRYSRHDFLTSTGEPQNTKEALDDSHWKNSYGRGI